MASETPDLASAARAVLADGARLVRDSASAAVVMFVLRGLAMRVERIEAMAKDQLAEHRRRVTEALDAQDAAERAKLAAEKRAAYQQGQAESMLATLEETRAAIDEATGSAPRSAHSIRLAIDRVKESAASAATKAWCEALEPVTEMLGVERPGGLAAVERIRSAVERLSGSARAEIDTADDRFARLLDMLGLDGDLTEEFVARYVRDQRDEAERCTSEAHQSSARFERVVTALGLDGPDSVSDEEIAGDIVRMRSAMGAWKRCRRAVSEALDVAESDITVARALALIRLKSTTDDQHRIALVRIAAATGFTNPSEVDVERMVTMIERLSSSENRAASILDAVLVALGIGEDTSEDAVLGAIRELVDDQRQLREMIRVLSSEIEFVERHEPHVLVASLVELTRGNLGARTNETLAMCVLRVRDRSAQVCRILGTSDIEDIVGAARRVVNERQQASAQAARAAVAIQDALLAAGVAPDRSDLPKSLDDLTAMLPRLSGPTVES